jgi:hypothetical protein
MVGFSDSGRPSRPSGSGDAGFDHVLRHGLRGEVANRVATAHEVQERGRRFFHFSGGKVDPIRQRHGFISEFVPGEHCVDPPIPPQLPKPIPQVKIYLLFQIFTHRFEREFCDQFNVQSGMRRASS